MMKNFGIIFLLVSFHIASYCYSQGPCGTVNSSNLYLKITPNQGAYCIGDDVDFKVEVTSTGFVLQVGSFSWSFSGSASGTSTGTNLFTISGLLTGGLVTVTGNVLVGGTLCPFTRTFTVLVNLTANAGPNLVVNAGQPQIAIGGTPASGSGGNPPLSYSWSGGSFVGSSTISNPVVDPTINTNYVVTVTDVNGCSETDDMDVIYTYSHGELKKTLNGGYYQVTDGKLYFTTDGEYNESTQLTYKIFDDQRGLRGSNLTGPSLAVKNGDNRYLLNLSGSLGFTSADNTNFFTLEVINEKNELFILKFKYDQ